MKIYYYNTAQPCRRGLRHGGGNLECSRLAVVGGWAGCEACEELGWEEGALGPHRACIVERRGDPQFMQARLVGLGAHILTSADVITTLASLNGTLPGVAMH